MECVDGWNAFFFFCTSFNIVGKVLCCVHTHTERHSFKAIVHFQKPLMSRVWPVMHYANVKRQPMRANMVKRTGSVTKSKCCFSFISYDTMQIHTGVYILYTNNKSFSRTFLHKKSDTNCITHVNNKCYTMATTSRNAYWWLHRLWSGAAVKWPYVWMQHEVIVK